MIRIRDWLFIGKYVDTRSADLLTHYGIGALLELAERVPQKDFEVLYLDIDDGDELPLALLEQGVQFIQQQKAADKAVLVACGAGISRSVVFGMAVLMEEEDLSIFESFAQIYDHHPAAEPHPELVKSLGKYHDEELDLLSIWRGLEEAKKIVEDQQ